MSNEENHELNNSSSNNYIMELPDKRGFLSSAIESIKNLFKPKDEVKYFPVKENKVKTTGRSIFSLLRGGTLRAAITTALDKASENILRPKSPKITNGFKTEIISTKKQDTPSLSREESPVSSQDKKIETLEKSELQISSIDSSAIQQQQPLKVEKIVVEKRNEIVQEDNNPVLQDR